MVANQNIWEVRLADGLLYSVWEPLNVFNRHFLTLSSRKAVS